jgi:hypothetical protein
LTESLPDTKSGGCQNHERAQSNRTMEHRPQR